MCRSRSLKGCNEMVIDDPTALQTPFFIPVELTVQRFGQCAQYLWELGLQQIINRATHIPERGSQQIIDRVTHTQQTPHCHDLPCHDFDPWNIVCTGCRPFY